MSVQPGPTFKRYAANGVATVYAIPFLLLDAADLQITLNGTLVTTGFTLSGVGNPQSTCTFAAPPTGDLLFQQVVPFQRLADYQNNGDFLAITVNRDFDRLWLAVKQLNRDSNRALTVSLLEPEGIPPLPAKAMRALKMLSFDANGDPITSNLTLAQLEQQPALALESAAAAAASALEALGYRNASALSAIAAAASELMAQKWAENPEDTPVTPGLFSAHHWANKTASVLLGAQRQIIPITASVAANAMTLGLPKTPIAFRSSSLTSGAVNIRDLAADLSLVIPSGATLGTASGTLGRVMLLAIDNAGAVELAVVNVSGGVNLDETGLISTTAITSGASSASVIYSTTARNNVPYRVVGFVDFTQAAAGTWATAPSRIQGAGGQSVAMNTIGMGQTWQNVAASRAVSTNYTNTTGRPILVSCSLSSYSANSHVSLTVNGVNVSDAQIYANGATGALSAIVPPGGVYSAQGTAAAVYVWAELRL